MPCIKNSFDFFICLGDVCNSSSYNELRWYIDIIDGEVITPSSGAHLGADTVDYQKQFKAAGLDKSIPFYQTLGNHDHFMIGSFPVYESGLEDSYISDTIRSVPNELLTPQISCVVLVFIASLIDPLSEEVEKGVTDFTGLTVFAQVGRCPFRDLVPTINFFQQETASARGDIASIKINDDVQIKNLSKIELRMTHL